MGLHGGLESGQAGVSQGVVLIEKVVSAIGVGVEIEELVVVAIGVTVGHAVGGHAVDESIGVRHEGAGFGIGVAIECAA